MRDSYDTLFTDTACGLEEAYSDFHCKDAFQSEFSNLHKCRSIKNSQNIRREELLSAVKKRHHLAIDESRGLSEVLAIIGENVEPMEVSVKKNKKRQKYNGKLMLSEYLKEMPEDFELKWIFKGCPKGFRSLVVAKGRTTISFNKTGHDKQTFESLLPGGGPNHMGSKFTILDCIYNPKTKSYHVLDILIWNSYLLLDLTAEFRFFFLKSKIEENPELSIASEHNRCPFFDVPAYPAQLPYIESMLSEYDENLDGVLFYHSEVDYRAGETPLVGWLKPFMVPEILHIPVNEIYIMQRPPNYSTLEDFIRNPQKCKKTKPKKVKDVEMVEDFEIEES